MRNLPDGILQVRLFADCHSLGHQQGKRALAEVLQQDLLPLHRLQILRQIVKQIIFRLGGCHAEDRRHHQCQTQDDNQHPVPDHPFCKALHCFNLLVETEHSVDYFNADDYNHIDDRFQSTM